ncbi:MAG: T9SS type B sorting domain-containing protein [Chitinophagaceae bacterium]
MRIIFLILLMGAFSFIAKADHITGGEMFYSYTGTSNGLNSYLVTLKLFMRCNSGRQFPNPAIISVFDKPAYTRITDISTPLLDQQRIQITDPDPCISDPPVVCYEVAYYTFSVFVPVNQSGYLLASQVNFRINGITNLTGGQVGATYTCEIPGTNPQDSGPANKSAVFTGSDLVIVCAGNYFTYSFGARDADGDQLRYSFCPAYRSSNPGVNGVPAGSPPYNSVPYNSPAYLESSPLGNKVTIDSKTGLISGVAPVGGVYVVTVCVDEIRNGTVIATQRKDLQINVADCSIAAASLEDDYMLCGDTRNITIRNISNSPLVVTYDWAVINPAGATIFTTPNTALTYTFPVNGKYTVQLIVNKGQPCSDTTTAPVFVYPGLVPDFTFTGICYTKPTFFSDRTTTLTGTVNSWKWNFGEGVNPPDISVLKNTEYTYALEGTKTVTLVVTTTEGCRDTISKPVTITDKPPIELAFRDTLICLNDVLQLRANGDGDFSWTPAATIINSNTASPFVSPVTTTVYYVDLETDGCISRDSVKVRVVDHVSLQVLNDTIICRGDTIQLRINSDGLNYVWTPAAQLIDPLAQNPLAITSGTTSYQVTATIGGCTATGNVTVNTIPYPLANAGRDTTICYNTAAQLHGSTNGTSWLWTPASSLNDGALLDPLAHPPATVHYTFKAYNLTSGCPKPGVDTVLITVLPKINAYAGNDTAVVVGQPLQLNASGGDSYLWSPAFPLSATNIPDPVAVFNEPSGGLRYKVAVYNSASCFDSAVIVIKIFAALPTVFVPNAFTPNNDGKNDVLRPIVAGMKRFDYFNVYNRWGQLVFTTSTDGRGWDGTINGERQASNSYVWMVKAVDFNGSPYFQKGTVTLIR